MADEMDRASEVEDLLRNAALSHRKESNHVYTGYCLNCDEPLAYPKRWCDADCRDDHEHRLRMGVE